MRKYIVASIFLIAQSLALLCQELPDVYPKFIARNEPIESFSEKNLIPFQEKLDSFLESYQNIYQAYQALEKDALSKFPDYTFMVGGKSYTLRRPKGGDFMGKIYSNGELSFVHYYKDLSMVFMGIQYSEGSSFLLVNLINKQEIKLLSPPIFNDDKSRILTYDNQGEADFGSHGFRLLKKDDNGNYWEYFSYDTTPLGPVYGEWINDKQIRMKFESRWGGMDIDTQYYQITIEETQ
mgnify:CR=1 FL=1